MHGIVSSRTRREQKECPEVEVFRPSDSIISPLSRPVSVLSSYLTLCRAHLRPYHSEEYIMTLSSGTMNLKFMQRAAARQQAQSPLATAGPSTPSSSRTPISKPTPTPTSTDQKPSASTSSRFEVLGNADAGPSTPASVAQEVDLTPAEKEARWSLPRRASSSTLDGSVQKWAFETGYMSFLLPSEERGESSGGGGRMAFGGFGKKDEEPSDQDDNREEATAQDQESLDLRAGEVCSP